MFVEPRHQSSKGTGSETEGVSAHDSLDEMIGAHLSSGRHLMPIPLERLYHDARQEIVRSAAQELRLEVDENTLVRIGQTSDGFPYCIHLLGEKLFWAVFDDKHDVVETVPNHFENALKEASSDAEPLLKGAYEKATQKYTDDYRRVLWAVADSPHLRRSGSRRALSHESSWGLSAAW
jgi:hypothetical protein